MSVRTQAIFVVLVPKSSDVGGAASSESTLEAMLNRKHEWESSVKKSSNR